MVRLQLLPQTVLADPMAPLFLGSLSCHVLFLLMAMVVHNFLCSWWFMSMFFSRSLWFTLMFFIMAIVVHSDFFHDHGGSCPCLFMIMVVHVHARS